MLGAGEGVACRMGGVWSWEDGGWLLVGGVWTAGLASIGEVEIWIEKRIC